MTIFGSGIHPKASHLWLGCGDRGTWHMGSPFQEGLSNVGSCRACLLHLHSQTLFLPGFFRSSRTKYLTSHLHPPQLWHSHLISHFQSAEVLCPFSCYLLALCSSTVRKLRLLIPGFYMWQISVSLFLLPATFLSFWLFRLLWPPCTTKSLRMILLGIT